jgi:mRNA-degrading endonuclease RelE of RelBE toxin-antitoxin system
VAFSIEYTEDARRELAAYPRRLRVQIQRAIRALAQDPHPAGSAATWGEWAGHRRLRVAGMQRVIYRIDYRVERIDIVAIRHRGQAYD